MDDQTRQVLATALEQAPPYIRDFIGSGNYERFIDKVRLAGNYHVDTVGIISDEVLMMLLGMSDPRELMDNLKKEAKLTDEQVGIIISIANEDIFAPLREEARKEEVPKETVGLSRPPLVPPPSLVETPAPGAIPGYPPDPTRPNQPAVASIAPVSTPPNVPPMAVPQAMPEPVRPMPPPPSVTEPPAAPTMRTMAHDVEAMKEGHASEPISYGVPAPAMSTPPAPRPSTPVTPPSTSPANASPTVSAPSAEEVHLTLKKYGIDPYREPIE